MASKYFYRLLTTVVFLFTVLFSSAQVPSFNIPDTVCVNSPVNITNTSTGASSYYWNFCTADLTNTPEGVNLGNLNGQFSAPVFADIVAENGKYYAFVTNYASATLVRLDFGTNMLNNNPVVTNLGGFNGALPSGSTEGIQVVKNEGKWYAIIVGGGAEAGTQPKVVKISFGTNIENNAPTATDYGNLDGALNFPHDLHIFQDKGTWYGFTVNKGGNTITRFNFTTSFENKPTATNLIAPGNSNPNRATGLFATNDENNNWHLFVVNSYDEGFFPPDDGTITRFDFGSSLLNNRPTAVNITNSQLDNTLHNPRDIYIIKFCGQVYGFVVNHASNDVVRLNFNNNITSIPTATSLGNLGNLNFPHSISKLFRVGSDVYSFIPNAASSTLTRVKFPGCTNSSTPNSQLKNPPAVTYNTPGVYNINLTINEGSSTQAALCKQVVVTGGPKLTLTGETAVCSGDSAHLKVTGGTSYTWSSPTGTIAKPNSDAIVVKPTATTKYYVTGKNSTGCTTKDSITVQLSPCKIVNASFTAPDTVCVNSPVKITNTSVGASSYYWNFCTANLNTSPVGVNIGNFGSLSGPVFSDFAEDNGNYYVFITNNYNGNLSRLDFGSSMLNPAPSLTNLGNFNGLVEANTEGVQVVKNNGRWYVFIVGGDPQFGTSPQLVKVDLGTNIANNAPTAENWGNVGGMDQPTDLYMFEDKGSWFGYTPNASNNTLTRISFGSDFSIKPVGTNLGNVGGLLNYPTGLFAMNDNNRWYVFVVSELSNTIARLDFGSSLLNTPTAVNILDPTSTLNHPRDITLIKSCDGIIGFSVNIRANELVKLNFGASITNTPVIQSLGNVGGLSWPHSISRLFRSGADVYGFVTNVSDNSITRLQFPGCTDASIPSSTAQKPPDITYSKPGVYNINLTIDDGLATQTSFCKQVVVTGGPKLTVTGETAVCSGDSAHLKVTGGVSYVWSSSTGAISKPNSDAIAVKPTATTKYYVTGKNSTGCTTKDSITVQLSPCKVVTASFTTPDTVCVNSPVKITNTSVGAGSYYWNFCTADINKAPIAENIGNPGYLNGPVFMDYVADNGKYYGFVVNNYSGNLIRLDFGTSLLNNNPVATDLGNFDGKLEGHTEGVQVVENNGKWYAFIVGGDPRYGDHPQLVKIEFGTNIANGSPVATDWGNLGQMDQPIDLYMFQDGINWHAFTVNSENNTITRFDFGNDFTNPPAAVNLGTFNGRLNYPTGISAIKDNNNWLVFVTNGKGANILRLDFGRSLLNNNPGVNDLGNPGGYLVQPRDFTILKDCEGAVGFAVNAANNDIIKYDFNGYIGSIPTGQTLGNIGNLDFPHSISKLFRAGPDVYAFITNVSNSTITRLKFEGCTNSSIASSTAQNPPDVKYSTPGVYNINLIIDDGGPTQTSFCKKVVVTDGPKLKVTGETAICSGDSAHLKVTGGVSYIWSSSTGTISKPNSDAIAVKPTATTKYYVTGKNSTGCATKDSITVQLSPCKIVNANFTSPDTVCVNSPVKITNTSVGASNYYWSFCTADINQPPTGDNLGDFGMLNGPVFSDFVEDNGKYYVFVVNNYSNSLARLDFGSSLLNNNPTVTDLGNFGGLFPMNPEGIQLVKVNGSWLAIIVGGDPSASVQPKIVKINFGTSLENGSPTITDWGNQGNMSYPHDLYVFSDGIKWYGFTVNARNNTITRFDFGTDFSSTPAATNLGNFGGTINTAVGICAVQFNSNWYAFVTNGGNSHLVRLDFGSNLLNTPVAKDLGNPGNVLNNPRDIYIMKYCGDVLGFAVNGTSNDIVRLDFNSDLTTTPTGVSLGNIGNLNFPHSISRLFRVNNDVYTFVTNVSNNTITRVKFSGCSNSNLPNSTAQNPSSVIYNTPGIYNITLTVDDGLPTQTSYCKQVVVKECNCTIAPDFSFKQGVCNPNTIQFSNETVDVKTVSWNFGNNQIAGNDLNPSVTYNTYGTYPVKLVVTTTTGCVDSITKQIPVKVIKDDIITTKDTVLCSPGKLQLNAVNALSYCWSPAAGLSATDVASPVADISKNTTYHLTSKVQGKNLIVNGDFSQGNTGFISGYNYAANNTTEGQYYVGPNPNAWNGSTTACSDHTGNNGSMMLVNGNPTPDLKVWTETITVQRNTNYAFSAWLQPIINVNPAQLQFYINGKTIGGVFNASLPTCNWQQFYVNWNSGDTDKVTISIINKNTEVQGNDFALDDISFAESTIKTDSVVIKTSAASVKVSADTSICAGGSVQISAQVQAGATFKWSPVNTLSNAAILSPVATPQSTTTYTINVTNTDGCKIQDSVKVTVLLQPTVKTIGDTSICNGSTVTLSTSVLNGNTYTWLPAQTLTDATAQSPVAKPSANTQYIITVNAGTACFARDTVNITIKPSPSLTLSNDTTLCNGTSVQLLATSTDNAGYTWDPASTLNSATISNPVASPTSTTIYHVLSKGGNGCTTLDSLTVTVLPQPTVKTIADTAICSGKTVTLTTTAVNGNTYSWLPAQNLTDAATQSPVANPTASTQYIVTVNAGSTCFARDTVNIVVKSSPVLQVSNDTTLCNGTSVQLVAASTDNPGYTWYPATALSNATISNPVASPTSTTLYHVSATGTNGCFTVDSLTVTVLPQPTVATIADTAICIGGAVNLVTHVVNGNTYSWLPVQGLSNAAQQSPQAKPLVNTQYIITINPGTPCFAKDTVSIIVNPLPVIQTSRDTTLCSGASVQLTAVSAGNVSYSWAPSIGISDPSVNNPVASPTSPTVYTVTVTDNNKCSAQSSVTINVIPQPVFAVSPSLKEICVGDVVTLTASGGDIYQWTPAETVVSPTSAITQVKPLSTTTYTAAITNSTCKISGNVSATVTVNDKLTTSVSKSNDVDCVQGSATLTVSGGLKYVWTPNYNITYPNSASPVVSPLQTTTYYVTSTKYGCKATDSITVYVSTANEENAYKMPSAFTPNGDGLNDCFGLKYWGGVKSLMFEVYNRWGNRIFYTTDPSKCWDGTYKGMLQMGGTYVYQISAVTICGNISRKGTVVLIR